MPTNLGERLGGPTRRIAIAGALIVVLVGAAIGVTLWRFGASADSYNRALANNATIARTGEARTSLFDILNAAQAYGGARNASNLAALGSARANLTAETKAVAATGLRTSAERMALGTVQSSDRSLDVSIAALTSLTPTQSADLALRRVTASLHRVDARVRRTGAGGERRGAEARKALPKPAPARPGSSGFSSAAWRSR